MKPSSVLRVSRERAGGRLDAFVAAELGLGRRYARRLIESGRIALVGRASAAGVSLRSGDRVEVAAFRHPDEGPMPDPTLRLAELAEGRGLLALSKPAGVASHPLTYDETGTALSAAIALRPEIAQIGEGVERGLVHRLDTGTSGVLLFATRPDAWKSARSEFAARRVIKRYIARVHGCFEGSAQLSLTLANRGRRVAVVERGGRESATRIRPLASGPTTSLVEVFPLTGLRHQIRATLAHCGHPIVGDQLYGSWVELGRHLLHAESLRIWDFEARAALPEGFETDS